jgi:hypothetical protein
MAFLARRMIWEFGYRRSKMEKIYRRIRTVYTIANTGYKANENTLDLELFHDYEVRYDPKVHRLRCQGHILNLAAHALSFCYGRRELRIEQYRQIRCDFG